MVKRYAFTMIELIFAIVVIALVVLSLPMMSDVTANTSANTMKTEEAIFQAYVKALEVTDSNYSSLVDQNQTDIITTTSDQNYATPSDKSQTIKYHTVLKSDVLISQGPASGFGGLDGGDNNISLVTVTIKDDDGVIAKVYTYDFNVQR